MSCLTIKQGATLPILEATLSWNGLPSDLSAVATVDVHMRSGAGVSTILTGGAVVSPTEKTVEYEWQAGDTDVVGTYEIEWWVTFDSGKVLKCPSGSYDELRIVDDL